MQSLPQMTAPPNAQPNPSNTHRAEDVVYQLVTVGAILLVLCTLWVF